MSSLTNFAVAYIVARELGLAELGAFVLVFALHALLIETSRATSAEVLAMEVASEPTTDDIDGAISTVCVIGILGGLSFIIAGAFTTSVTSEALTAIGLFTTFAAIQDGTRNTLIAIGKAKQAAISDFVWVLTQVTTFTIVLSWSTVTVSSAIAAWGTAAAVAAFAGVRLANARLSALASLQWIGSRRAVIRPLLLEAVGRAGFLQLATIVIVSILTIDELGRLRASEMLFGPIAALIIVIPHIAVPEATRARSDGALRTVALASSFVPAAAAILLLVSIGLTPDSFGEVLLADNWEPARALALPAAALTFGSAALVGAFVGLRGRGRVRETLQLRILGGVLVLTLGSCGALIDGITLAAWGIALARMLIAGAAWVCLARMSDQDKITLPPAEAIR